MELKLFIAMLTIFISYISFIWIKYGVQTSISKTYYILPVKWNMLFTLFMWGYAFPAMILGLSLTNSGLMFGAASGIIFVGAAAAFKEKITKTVHYIGAYGGIMFSQLSICLDFKMWYLTVDFILSAILILLLQKVFKFTSSAWWIEILAFFTMALAFILKMN